MLHGKKNSTWQKRIKMFLMSYLFSLPKVMLFLTRMSLCVKDHSCPSLSMMVYIVSVSCP